MSKHSREAILPFIFGLSSHWASTFKGKNLLQKEFAPLRANSSIESTLGANSFGSTVREKKFFLMGQILS